MISDGDSERGSSGSSSGNCTSYEQNLDPHPVMHDTRPELRANCAVLEKEQVEPFPAVVNVAVTINDDIQFQIDR